MESEDAVRLTVKDAVDFVLRHRKDKVFKDHSPEEIALDIFTAIRQQTFGYALNPKGELIGVCVCEPEYRRKILHVSHCLAIAPCLKTFAQLYQRLYPGWTISALRRGRPIVYRTHRLMHFMEAL